MGVVAPFLSILFHMLILFDFLFACLGGAALTRKSLGLSVDNSEPLFAAPYHKIIDILTGPYRFMQKITVLKPVLW